MLDIQVQREMKHKSEAVLKMSFSCHVCLNISRKREDLLLKSLGDT